jgi:HEAT repeat protein
MDDSRLIEHLAVPHRARHAYADMLRRGLKLLPMARAGLTHPDPAVRAYCCRFLDHYVVPEAVTELIAMLGDPDPAVRAASLHALACDRCKEGACRPDETLILEAGLRLLADDPDAHVRAHAAGVVGVFVHTRSEAVPALLTAIAGDPDPTVRKKAKWYAPGGPIWRRTAPKPQRKPHPLRD